MSRGFGALVDERDQKFLKVLEAVESAGSSNMHHLHPHNYLLKRPIDRHA